METRGIGRRLATALNARVLLRLLVLTCSLAALGFLNTHEGLGDSVPEGQDVRPLPPVVINELLTHTDPPQVDSIELFNLTSTDLPLDGWCLSDDQDAPCRYRIPAQTVIEANGYLVFTQEAFSFGLSEMGEEVLLSEATPQGELTGAQHRVGFDAAANGVSLGRIVSSDGKEHFPPLTIPTPGAANAPPMIGPVVIAELMYHPPPGKDEYVELVNLTTETVALFDQDAPENLWRLTGVGDFSFPTGLKLPARASLFVTPLAPGEFRARHDLPDDALVVGPYSGALSDGGEEVALWQPDEPDLDGAVPFLPVDRVDYGDQAPWPATPDGGGPALQRRNVKDFGGEPQNWQANRETSDGEPLVELAHFVVAPGASGRSRQARWSTRRERNIVGFTLWRSASGNRAAAVQVGGDMVIAQGGRHLGGEYAVDDLAANEETAYTYWLAAVKSDQESIDVENVFAPALTRTFLPIATSN
jgi:hypothetical protein